MPFFEYVQNNSFGEFHVSENTAPYVIIEASDASAANVRAEGLGIYFHGCENGLDCPCCGDRWNEAWKDDGSEVPTLYGTHVLDQVGRNRYDLIIHYLDGRKVRVSV
jgi:hypothetical protein